MTIKILKPILAVCLSAILFSMPMAGAVHAKQCHEGHWHHGSSGATPYKTKRAALRAAITSWREFTAFEYGIAWAYFRSSADKSTKCDKHPGNRWSCTVDARPCKRGK